MRIVIIQEKGRHLKNENFREALNFHRAFKSLGVDSLVWGLNYESFNTPLEILIEKDDVILLLEDYEVNGWIPDLSNFKNLTLYWSRDSHCVPQAHVNTCKKHNINIVLNAIQHHQSYFQPTKTYWFPNAYPHDLIHPMENIEQVHDVGFCGNYLNRKDWVDIIDTKFKVKRDIFVIGEDMVKAVNGYKIHFNRNISDDINFRTFETLGCNTLLFTNYTPDLEKLFNTEKDMVLYKDGNDLLEKLTYYLNNPVEKNKISNSGFETVTSKHTFVNRAKELIKIIKENI
tara:strand:+ start:338 stop:1198 length:861 start_codon:yes stop_codon:yes gene_type:complete